VTSREEAHKRRAEAREMRRAKLSTSRGDDEEGKQRKGSGENRNAENSTTENSPGRTAAKVAVIGASVGAVTLAGKKLLSFRGPRREKGGEAG
jgi:hypothetical protein